MIISHKHRFIFFAVPKTGSQSIRTALRAYLDDGDWEQADWRVHKRSPVPQIAAIEHGHVGAAEAMLWLEERAFTDYFKFAFVRNPWHRFVSSAFFKNAQRRLFLNNPRGYLKLLLRSPHLMEGLFFRPQHSFLTAPDGNNAMNFTGRFETLQDGFDVVCRQIGLPRVALTRLNPSGHGAAANYFDDDLLRAVAEFYALDIAMFGYEWGPVSALREQRGPLLCPTDLRDEPTL